MTHIEDCKIGKAGKKCFRDIIDCQRHTWKLKRYHEMHAQLVTDSNFVKTLGKFLTEVWLLAKLCNSGFYQDVKPNKTTSISTIGTYHCKLSLRSKLTLDVNIRRLHCGGRLFLLLVYSNHIRTLLLKNLWFDLESQWPT